MRATVWLLALALVLSAPMYVASAALMLFMFSLGAVSLEVLAMIGVLGAAALACLVLAGFLIVKPHPIMFPIGGLLVVMAAVAFLANKHHL